MKIAIVSNLYPPFIRGGAEIIAAMQAEGLKEAWQHVFVISTKPRIINVQGIPVSTGNTSVVQDRINDIDVYRFTPSNIYYYLADYKYPAPIRLLWHIFDMFNIFSYFRVKKILAKEKPDIVISHNLMGIGFLLPMLFRKMGIKHIHVLHDVQLVTPSGLIIKGKEGALVHKFFKKIGYVRLMRYLMASPDVVISPSKFLLDFYKRSNFFPKSKKVVLPNPIKQLIQVEKKEDDNFNIFYLGQINKAKGVLELVESFKAINEEKIKLNIIGVGQDLKTAKSMAKSDARIKFYGWLEHKDMLPLVSSMDILVVPSMCYENSPAVIYEVLSMGIPVMAADIGGVAELIKEGKNGWVFPAGDFDDMKKKIVALYNRRVEVDKMSDYCRYSIKSCMLDKHIEKLLKLANELVEEK